MRDVRERAAVGVGNGANNCSKEWCQRSGFQTSRMQPSRSDVLRSHLGLYCLLPLSQPIPILHPPPPHRPSRKSRSSVHCSCRRRASQRRSDDRRAACRYMTRVRRIVRRCGGFLRVWRARRSRNHQHLFRPGIDQGRGVKSQVARRMQCREIGSDRTSREMVTAA